jgi:uncharacterized RDD family membrane protein YckC
MLSIVNRLALVAARDVGEGKSQLAVFLLEDDNNFNEISLKSDGAAAKWDTTALPLVSRLGDQLELVWRQDGKLWESRCNLDGQLTKPAVLPQGGEAQEDRSREISQYYLMTVLVLVALLVFVLRPPSAPAPFSLPADTVPGPLGRRALAAIVDFMPWSMLSLMFFRIPRISFAELRQLMESQGAGLESLVYVQMLSTTLFVVYCAAMEYAFGATLGKMLFRLRVTGNGGAKPDLRSIALRNLMKIVEMTTIMLPLLVLLPLLSQYRQRIGDMMARTAVVDARLLPTPPPFRQPQDQPPQE